MFAYVCMCAHLYACVHAYVHVHVFPSPQRSRTGGPVGGGGMHRAESFVVPMVGSEYQFPLQAPSRAGCVIMSEFSTAAYVASWFV